MTGIFPSGGVPANQAQNSDPDAVVTNGCTPLWHSTSKCPPRFDPVAANAVISEIINAVNCSGLPYDCNKLDNLCTAIKSIVDESLYDCLPRDFPDAGSACSIEHLVQVTDSNGCRRIARLAPSSGIISIVQNQSVWGNTYSLRPHPLAGQETVGVDIYNSNQLNIDYRAGTINRNVLYGPGQQNWLAQSTFTIPCDMDIAIEYGQVVEFAPKRNNGDGTLSSVVMELDGTLVGDGNVVGFAGTITNFINIFTQTAYIRVTAGTHNIRFIMVANTPVPTRLNVDGVSGAGGTWTIRSASN